MKAPEKIVITGPESTGKTTLAQALASRLKTIAVPEYARQYIDKLNRPYHQHDLVKIAEEQVRLEATAQQQASNIYVCDTDLLTIKIWMEDKFKTSEPWLEAAILQRTPTLYLLCDIDLPWDADPQREDGHRREQLMQMYERELNNLNVKWQKIKGTGESRTLNALAAIKSSINQSTLSCR